MKAIRHVKKNNQSVLPHIVILECVCTALKSSENTEEGVKNLRPAILQVRNSILFTGYCFSMIINGK
jgi:hypothetical protein